MTAARHNKRKQEAIIANETAVYHPFYKSGNFTRTTGARGLVGRVHSIEVGGWLRKKFLPFCGSNQGQCKVHEKRKRNEAQGHGQECNISA